MGSFAIHEEGRGEAQHAVAACRLAIGVEQWHEPIKAELLLRSRISAVMPIALEAVFLAEP